MYIHSFSQAGSNAPVLQGAATQAGEAVGDGLGGDGFAYAFSLQTWHCADGACGACGACCAVSCRRSCGLSCVSCGLLCATTRLENVPAEIISKWGKRQ